MWNMFTGRRQSGLLFDDNLESRSRFIGEVCRTGGTAAFAFAALAQPSRFSSIGNSVLATIL